MTAADKASAVSVFSSERIFITVKSYPELVYCDIVTRCVDWVVSISRQNFHYYSSQTRRAILMLSGYDWKFWCNSGGKMFDFEPFFCLEYESWVYGQVQFSNRIANGSISVDIPGGSLQKKTPTFSQLLNWSNFNLAEISMIILSTHRTNICLVWSSTAQRRHKQHVSSLWENETNL